ncbi:hypothetical protein BDV26DRAFT_302826 [Aspergillus bertholletiae]|uniref:ATP-grasp domain-containing protein n=1 Tax=Aspergillus bertholletiae TaxID=1226010 RepID=A0A5N7ARE0_9EURO|nr:hypothetical protein BDV26DRAFT_302826 [Aspergillus bertholletiae]
MAAQDSILSFQSVLATQDSAFPISIYELPKLAQGPSQILCRWGVHTADPVLEPFGFTTVEMVLWSTSEPIQKGSFARSVQMNNHALEKFMLQAIGRAKRGVPIGFQLLLPVSVSYVARSDILEFRMQGCDCVATAAGLMQSREKLSPWTQSTHGGDEICLEKVLNGAIGVIQAKNAPGVPVTEALDQVKTAIVNRLSFRWLLPEPVQPRRLAMVEVRPDHKSIEAIYSLGIQLIVLDQPGHWLEPDEGPYAHLRESFVPFDTNVDSHFGDRLTRALEALRVDGVVTRNDRLVTAVARVAETLGFPTSPAVAFEKATNKYATRLSEIERGFALCVSGPSDLQEKLHPSDRSEPIRLEYPLVVKPCEGDGSHCVSKVSTETQLFQAVEKVGHRIIRHEGAVPVPSDVLIEPYIDGPEVDVNFVLWDGEVLFSDVSDDFPSDADSPEATAADTFQETAFAHPSRLPPSEQDLLRQVLLDRILHMGFRSGIFHVEARVRHSAMKYTKRDGTLDLRYHEMRDETHEPKASVFLVEVNARPPGYYGLMSLAWTYGVDYFALHVLHALSDETRMRALSQPFLHGPQHDGALMLVLPERGGVLTSGDPAETFRKEHPEVMDNILLRREPFAMGDFVPGPDAPTMGFLSVLVVRSTMGRAGLLRNMAMIRRDWRHTIE